MKRKTLHAIIFSAIALSATAENDFSNGVFIVNEDWYGHQNSTINYFDSESDEPWQYRVFQTVNSGYELGCTNQYGQIYGDRFYLIAKQEKDPGASIVGGRITVADAKTMKVLFQSPVIDSSGATCDGRGYLGIDEHKGYISTSNGIWVFDTDTYTVTGQVSGSGNSSGSLYEGQCGSMVRINNRVFAAHQSAGVLVIDPETDVVTDVISMSIIDSNAGVGSVVLGGDGYVYVSVAADITGSGATLPYLLKVNPKDLAVEVIDVPADFNAPANSWYAWTPDGFCSSAAENVLYWNGGDNSWFSGSRIFKYDLESGVFSKIIDLDEEAAEQGLGYGQSWQLYGCSMRPHPVTGEIYLSLFHGFSDPTYRLRRTDATGNTLGEYDMISNYWFPSLPVFPDNEYPEVKNLAVQYVNADSPTTISLKDWATDADNLDAAIVKSVAGVSSSDFAAEIVDGDLVVTPVNAPEGNQSVEIKVNSNGHIINATIDIAFENSGVDFIENPQIAAISVNGKEIKVSGHKDDTCRICSVAGVEVLAEKIDSDSKAFIADLHPGIYIVSVGKDKVKIVIR